MNTEMLLHAHALSGDPHARLETALCALEGCDWALALASERALVAQLGTLLGGGVLRADPLLGLSAPAWAEAGLALTGLDGDWRGAAAVWLLSPTEDDLARAERAGVVLIADATWLPGEHAGTAGLRVYRNAAALSGFGGQDFAAVLGSGEAPARAAAGAADLTVSLLLRDLATLPLRAARSRELAVARAGTLGSRQLGSRQMGARHLGGGLLLLAPDTVPQTVTPLGGVMSAACPALGGTLATVGLHDPDEFWQGGLPAGALSERVASAPQPTNAEAQTAGAQIAGAQTAAPQPEPEAAVTPQVQPEPQPDPGPLSPDLPELQASDPADSLDDEQHAAYMRLREWRNAEARRQEVSTFIVSANATLADIAREHPRSLEELSRIRGMGPARLARYGAAILRVLG